MTAPLPRAARPFVTFATLLRAHGFSIAPEQTAAFVAAVGLLGPRGLGDIRNAAHATFAPPPERRAELDALFRAHFLGAIDSGPVETDDAGEDDDVRVHEDDGFGPEPPLLDRQQASGEEATRTEVLGRRAIRPLDPSEALRRFRREAPSRLPHRRGYRLRPTRRGRLLDLRSSLRSAVAHDGDVAQLRHRRRRPRLRNVLVLIDVSGSMKAESEGLLRFAHALARSVERIEVFTVGTRLTRITRALRLRREAQALDAAAAMVSDFDGGTRLGDALQAFLAVPRFAGYARGAVVLILSDGLERGEPAALVDAVRRLQRRAWHLAWLTPLARDPAFVPETAALRLCLPHLDSLGDAGSLQRVCAHVLELGR
jgi:uncharacterized protein with von Willebrand factor type A (vWA) domain